VCVCVCVHARVYVFTRVGTRGKRACARPMEPTVCSRHTNRQGVQVCAREGKCVRGGLRGGRGGAGGGGGDTVSRSQALVFGSCERIQLKRQKALPVCVCVCVCGCVYVCMYVYVCVCVLHTHTHTTIFTYRLARRRGTCCRRQRSRRRGLWR
jgi:hypothetical protein